MPIVDAFPRALSFAVGMAWEITWAVTLVFFLSAVVQAVVSKAEMTRLVPDDSPAPLDDRVAPAHGESDTQPCFAWLLLDARHAAS